MKKILENLARIEMINFSKEHNIDVSGSHLVKNGRGFNYSLVSDETGEAIITVLFSKNSVPRFMIRK
jgi:predicted nucleotide-binding protein (sugar kinase/HSP70/actin superfamily)